MNPGTAKEERKGGKEEGREGGREKGKEGGREGTELSRKEKFPPLELWGQVF
jgi:hypothetical protein